MKYSTIKIGRDSLSLSKLGFGCMRFPIDDGDIDYNKTKELIDYAISNGINYFDTAYDYHNGRSEVVIGQILSKYPRDKYYIADKLPLYRCKTIDECESIFYEQLSKLGTPYIDFYLIHALNRETFIRMKDLGVIPFLVKLKSKGLIKYIGFSFHDSYDVFIDCVNYYKWDFVQIQLNYFDTDFQQGVKGYVELVKKNIPIFIMEPTKGGRLVTLNKSIREKMESISPNKSIASWAFRWFSNLRVSVVLSGMSYTEHLKDNIETFSTFESLKKDERLLISTIVQELKNSTKVECTYCNYCAPCPKNVAIAQHFYIYNQFAMFNNHEWATQQLSKLEINNMEASNCIDCGICSSKCPQKIQIPNVLEEFQHFTKKYILLEVQK